MKLLCCLQERLVSVFNSKEKKCIQGARLLEENAGGLEIISHPPPPATHTDGVRAEQGAD